MKKVLFFFLYLFIIHTVFTQEITARLRKAFLDFERDEQLRSAIASLYVVEAKSGKIVFEKNAGIGLAPASTLKVLTSVTALEMLGKDFRFHTEFGFQGFRLQNKLKGRLLFFGSFDPTLGSERWPFTKDSVLMKTWAEALIRNGIEKVEGTVQYVHQGTTLKTIPDGWIWQDIGNYYGAPAHSLNWKENKFSVHLRSGGRVGDSVQIIKPARLFKNELRSARAGTGDNAYVYFDGLLSGTIPVNEDNFVIYASDQNPAQTLCSDFSNYLRNRGILEHSLSQGAYELAAFQKEQVADYKTLYIHRSPALDSIIYWFNKKSINLYGEALLKAMAFKYKKQTDTDSGIAVMQEFWKSKGIPPHELNLYDGSGLSPQNRITTRALTQALFYLYKKEEFSLLLNAFPEYNGMKMKSGTIRDVKGFCGYHKSNSGNEYLFTFLVNNYNGKTSDLVLKMYKVLDQLKR
ncbi:MAG: D-alanyl-D-alanine carboxypeptidase/D-alanyl-D-alanine-endopeptidase [Chitinophagaceae bacterium]|nr:D-alanyl-D-alanine carboxypeptidase/D-alanyl-D-alanine-endopeptidase [Chitinophagaceae bacterium]